MLRQGLRKTDASKFRVVAYCKFSTDDPAPPKIGRFSRLAPLAYEERYRIGAGVAFSTVSSGLTLLFPRALGMMLDRTTVPAAVPDVVFKEGTADSLVSQLDASPEVLTAVPDEAVVFKEDTADNLMSQLDVSPEALLDVMSWEPETISAALFGVAVVQCLVMVGRSQLLTKAGENISARLRERALNNLVKQELAFFDNEDSAELVSRLSSDTAQLQKALTLSVVSVARNGTMAAGAAGCLIATSPSLAAMSLASFPPVFLYAAWKGRRMRKQQASVQEAIAESNAVAMRALSNLRGLRSLGADAALMPQYEAAVAAGKTRAVDVGVTQSWFDASVHLAGNAALLGVLAFGAGEVTSGSLTIGDLTSFMMYSIFLGFQTSGLSATYADLQRALGASERVLALAERKSPMVYSHHANKDGTVESGQVQIGVGLEFFNSKFAYPTRPDSAILRDLSLTIEPGEVVGIQGQSGCGKSTLSRLLLRLYDVDAGSVSVGGVDVRSIDVARLRGGIIGVVPQEPFLLSGTIEDNIQIANICGGEQAATVQSAAEAAGLGPLLSRLPSGLKTPVGEGGVQLSGGERQRVAIARALMREPRVLLLDEFTSALDAGTEATVIENIRGILCGRTVLVVAHHRRVFEALQVSRVVTLGPGGVILSDEKTHAEKRSKQPSG